MLSINNKYKLENCYSDVNFIICETIVKYAGAYYIINGAPYGHLPQTDLGIVILFLRT